MDNGWVQWNSLPNGPEIDDESLLENTDMNDDEPILVELRKISGWIDAQRKIAKWSIIGAGVLVFLMIVGAVLLERQVTANLEGIVSEPSLDWYVVEHDARAGEFEKAIQNGEELIAMTPESHNAHRRLGGVYLAAGEIEEARGHYSEAFRLFPSKENEELLIAIGKRIEAQGQLQGGARNGILPSRSE